MGSILPYLTSLRLWLRAADHSTLREGIQLGRKAPSIAPPNRFRQSLAREKDLCP